MTHPRRYPLRTLQARFLLALVLIGVLPVGLLGLGVATLDRQVLIEQSERELTGLARGLAGQLDVYVAELLSDTRAIAALPTIVSMDPTAHAALLSELFQEYRKFVRLSTYDRSGQLLASPNPEAPHSITARESFQAAVMRGQQSWEVASSLVDRRSVLLIRAPIFNAEHQVAGVLTGVVDLESLSAGIGRVADDDGGLAFVLDRDGRALLHPDRAIVQERRDLSARGMPLAGPPAAGTARYESDGQARVAGYATVPQVDWTVVVERPEAEVLAPAERSWRLALTGLLASALLALIAAVVLARTLTRPVRELAVSARALAAGDQPVLLPTRKSDDSEVGTLVEAFSEMCQAVAARAAERDQLLVREQGARAEAEAAQRRAAFLAEASTLLDASLDYETTLQSLARLAVPRLGDMCCVDVVEEDDSIRRVAVAHVDPAKEELAREVQRRYPPTRDAPTAVPKVLRTGQGEIAPEVTDARLVAFAQDADHLAILRQLGPKSALNVPLLARGRTLGALTLLRTESDQRYGPADLALAEDLARRAALAVDNVRLYRRAQEDLAERKRAEEVLRFLAEASTLLDASLDYETTLQSLARLAVPRLGDMCCVDVVEEDDSIRRVAVAHVDPAKEELARELQRCYPPDPNAPAGAPNVLRTGQSELYTELPEALLQDAFPDAAALAARRAPGVKSTMVVPLRARGRTLGALTCLSAESGRLYSPADLRVAEDLGRRAALAVDNARLYAAAEHERARLEEANRAKDEFLATVSHELRTPLTIILGWAQILQRGNLDAIGQARALELLERSAQAQAQVIEDLLDVSRAITGNVRLAIRLLELSPVIESAMDAVRPAAEAKGIRLEATLDRAAGPVSGDADRLQQVVWNLLSNAIKFTPSGGRVQVHLARADAQVEIGVSDTGPGIPPAFLPYVFDRFRQADSTLTRAHGGLGLGLAIVRHLVELHGGTVQATSPGQGQGASFTVRLPLARAGRAPALVEPARPAPAPAAPLGGARALDGLRLLVVDDEADARELLTTLFQDSGAEVTAVASAAEVLAALDRAQPDVLVADIAMPGVDGYALIRQVRACPAERGGRVPALALTAYAGPKDRARALAEGFQEHVSKPIDVPTLTAVVARLAGPTAREVPLSR